MDIWNEERFTHEGREFFARLYYYADMGRPWEEHDGHGPVRIISSLSKKFPGERIFTCGERNAYVYAYDWAAALKTARKEWGLSAEDLAKLEAELGRKPTKGQIAERAVQKDFDHLDGWANNRWHWIGVSVVRINPETDEPDEEDYRYACWGVESEGDHWKEIACEEADNIIAEDFQAAVDAAKEAAEVQWAAERDIITK